ncbi:MAG: hypothetical protein R6U66_13250 [Bacteroidales bacterium]
MKKIITILLTLLAFTAFSQKATIENMAFRNGDAKIPFPGKGTITTLEGKVIKGEFRKGMMVKMNKWQWYDNNGKLHQIKKKEIKKIVFYPDPTELSKVNGPDVSVNISIGNNAGLTPKTLQFDVEQPKDFDFTKAYEPVIMERVEFKNGKSRLMVLVNNGYDSKIKAYVNPNRQLKEYGHDMSLFSLIFGGGEVGAYYNGGLYLKKGDELYKLGRKPSLFAKWIKKPFRINDFELFFGDNEKMIGFYPGFKTRKYENIAEYIWVYDRL